MLRQYQGLLIILDGVGDRPVAILGGATPLEAAATPNLDRLAAVGLCGLVDPLVPGLPVDTHTGTGVLMGLTPKDAHQLSRGPVEAAGAGLFMQPGDVALRCNFATLEADGNLLRIIDRRAGRIREGTDALAAVLRNVPLGNGITASLQPATQHRAVLRLSGPGLSAAISDTDPGSGAKRFTVLDSRPLKAGDSDAANTAAALNRFVREAFERLRNHPLNRDRAERREAPANGIITRGAGAVHRLHNLVHHAGLRAAVVVGEDTVAGLGRLFDFTVISDPRFTSLATTDLSAKVAATQAALETHDLVFLHIKAPDICAHDRDPEAKRAVLERIDAALGPLLRPDLVIGVTGDHSTDSNSGRHCGDPVPSILYSPSGRRDGCLGYGERQCMGGGLGRITATSLLVSVLDAMGSLGNFSRADRLFFSPPTV